MDNLTLTKEIHAPQEIKLDPVEEQRKKFEHQLQKFQGDKKEYFRQRRLKDKDAANGITFEETTKKVSTGKFSSKIVKERKMVLNNKRIDKNASDKFRRLTKKVLGNGASLDLLNENLSEKAKGLLQSLVTYSKIDAVGSEINQYSDSKKELHTEGKLAFSITKEMEAFLSTEATEEEKQILQPHLDRMLASTRGTLNIGNNPVEDCSGFRCYEKEKVKSLGFFARIKNIFSSNPEEPTEVVKSTKLKMASRKDQALFPHEPSLNDICQGGLGDCYFLAAISSIINSNPDAIKSCMKDEGDTVVVRFYHPETKDGNTTMVPHYYRVDKSVPVDSDGDDLYAKGSLWVQMLEKAYVASGLNVSEDVKNSDEYKNRDKKTLQYNEIASGQLATAFSHITGKEQDTISLKREAKTAVDIITNFYETSEEATRQKELLRSNNVPEDLISRIDLSTISALLDFVTAVKNQTFLNMYYEYVRADIEDDGYITYLHEKSVKKACQIYRKDHANDPDFDPQIVEAATDTLYKERNLLDMSSIVKMSDETLKKTMTIEEFSAYLRDATVDTFPFRSDVKTEDRSKLLNMLKAKLTEKDGVQKLLGERKIFSGEYDDLANEIFKNIKEGEQNNMVMSATAGDFLHNDASIGLNKESMDKGMVSKHAYSVLGVETYENKKFIRLRNPWGQGTREYQELEDKKLEFERVDDENNGIFAVELNDFMNHFIYIHRGEA